MCVFVWKCVCVCTSVCVSTYCRCMPRRVRACIRVCVMHAACVCVCSRRAPARAEITFLSFWGVSNRVKCFQLSSLFSSTESHMFRDPIVALCVPLSKKASGMYTHMTLFAILLNL